jgi:hypothetical protein
MKTTKIGMFLIATLLLNSCEKLGIFDSGETITVTRNTGKYTTIILNDFFDVFLANDTTDYIEITGGSNILPNVTTDNNNDTITINNHTKYRWARSYDRVEIVLHTKNLNRIILEAPCSVKTLNQFTGTNLHFTCIGKTSEIDLDVNLEFLGISIDWESFDHIKVKGTANSFYVDNWCSSMVIADELVSKNVRITNGSISDCYVNATEKLTVFLASKGNIYYKGNPSEIIIGEQSSDGRLIKLDK